jgi:hypothetical protein
MHTQRLVYGTLLLLLPSALAAQGEIDSTSYPPRQTYAHSFPVTSAYDAAQDKTVLQVGPFALDSTVSVSVLTALDGQRVTKPATSIILTFWSTAPAGRYATSHAVRVVLNGTDTLDLGNAWLPPNHRPEFSEVLLKGAFLAQFLAIANASSVTFLVGPSTWRLGEAELQSFRNFASRMAPVPP